MFAQAASSVARASKTEAKARDHAVYGLPQKRVDDGLRSHFAAEQTSSPRPAPRARDAAVIRRPADQAGFHSAQSCAGRQVIRLGTPRQVRRRAVQGPDSGAARLPIKVLYGPTWPQCCEIARSERFVVRPSARKKEPTRRIFRELDKR